MRGVSLTLRPPADRMDGRAVLSSRRLMPYFGEAGVTPAVAAAAGLATETAQEKAVREALARRARMQLSQQYKKVRQELHELPPEVVLQRANTYGDFVTAFVPQVGYATPVIAGGYAGYDIFRSARSEYQNQKDKPRKERLKSTALKALDTTLFHVIGTITIPIVLGKTVFDGFRKLLRHPKAPKLMVKRARLFAALGAAGVVLGLSRPIGRLANWILNMTYRPYIAGEPLPWLKKKQVNELPPTTQNEVPVLPAPVVDPAPESLDSTGSPVSPMVGPPSIYATSLRRPQTFQNMFV